jgi:predicted lactoylglutathione lyase
MISYVTVGTNDFVAAEQFFDALLGQLNRKQAVKTDRMIFWAGEEGAPGFAIAKPLDGQAATVGNGSMIALSVDTRGQVDSVYQKALELGGSDEGEARVRDSGFYVAYFRDLDGNKFCLFCAGM